MQEIYGTKHEFRKIKRKQVRAAEKALRELRLGCAYCPAMNTIVSASKLIRVAMKQLSVKEWGK